MKITRSQLRRLITETMITPYSDDDYIKKVLGDPQVDDRLKELLRSDDEETRQQGLNLLATLYSDYDLADESTYRDITQDQAYRDAFDKSGRMGIDMHLKEPIMSRFSGNGVGRGNLDKALDEILDVLLNYAEPQHFKAFLEGELYLVSHVGRDDTGFFDEHSLNIPDIGVETTKYTLLTEDEHDKYRDTIYDHYENVLLPIFYQEWQKGYELEPGVQLVYWSPFARHPDVNQSWFRGDGFEKDGWHEFENPVMPHVETYFDDHDPDDVAALAELKKQLIRYSGVAF